MKLFRFLMVAALAIVTSASVQAGALTGVVLSNLGTDGITGTSAISQNVNGAARGAFSFTVGASDFTLDAMNIYGFGDSSSTVTGTLSLFADNSGNPASIDPANALYSATNTNMTGDGHYTFDFANPTLTAGTTYWVVLTTSGLSSSWYLKNGAPASYAPGGITYGTAKETTTSGASWNSLSPFAPLFAISGSPTPAAVPEPALTSLLCLSGIALIRRRMKK